ncbi:MAG: Alpha/beta hydrolase fold protein [uncultured Aureispira sp.]|uniref:Alpha/beta hydrolase fold protein n=1 Tax=uncultured Aureispira sp. TaxID=1331704 RepID=A0A6S6UHJ6_9BACT|nr:MAG: Alpha/beta hydrolase fold protein [uncultured Aureispira sp.]
MATFEELIHKYTTDQSRFLIIDDMLVHYRDEGEGEPIVLLHGAFSSLHTFNEWSKILQKNYRVISLDLMGFGLTGPNKTGDYTIGNHIRVLKRFFNILGLKKAHLVGSSLGGWLAWEFTYRYPQRINKLVLVDSAGFLDKENMPLPFKLAQSPLAGRVLKYIVRKSILEQFVKQVYYDISKINTKLVDRYFDLFTREGNSQAFVDLVNAPYQENTNFLSKIKHSTLIMWGREDAWIGAINAYLFDKMLPNSELIIYEEVGHLPMEEIPVRSGEDLMAFLKK